MQSLPSTHKPSVFNWFHFFTPGLCFCLEEAAAKSGDRRQLQDLSLPRSLWPSRPTAGLSASTHTLSLGKCHSAPPAPSTPSLLLTPCSPSPPSSLPPHPSPDASGFQSWSRRQSHITPTFQDGEVGGVTAGSEDNWRSHAVPAATGPVLTQPGLGVTTTTITTITQTGGDWSTGLLDVCRDKTTCILGALVPCCLDFSLAQQYGECLCMPLLPGSTFAMRVGIRERYKIRGSVCEDWTTVYCCYPLAVCQMIREMKQRMKTQTYHVSTALVSS